MILLVTIAISLAAFMFWAANTETLTSYLNTSNLSISNSSIESAELLFKGDEIFLTVYLKEKTECNDIINMLGVRNLVIMGKLYNSSCIETKSEFVRIVYRTPAKI
jgi:hypothetical protein